VHPSGTLRQVLFKQVITGTSVPVPMRNYQTVTVYVTGYGTISTGTLLIEEADYDGPGNSGGQGAEKPFEGTWSLVQTLDLTAVTGGSTTGKQIAYHVPSSAPGFYAYSYLRARFSVDITGASGSATVVLLACGPG